MHLACRLTVDLSMTGKYQPTERKFQISQRMREVCLDLGFTVTVLSRLPLVMHDPDLLQSGH
jgi:DNA repair photolyase